MNQSYHVQEVHKRGGGEGGEGGGGGREKRDSILNGCTSFKNVLQTNPLVDI